MLLLSQFSRRKDTCNIGFRLFPCSHFSNELIFLDKVCLKMSSSPLSAPDKTISEFCNLFEENCGDYPKNLHCSIDFSKHETGERLIRLDM